MNVLYCKRHKQLAQVAWACPESDGFCNAVPMRLIPDNAVPDREALVVALVEFEVQWSQSLGAHTISQHTQFALRDAARAWLAIDGETP